MPCGLLSSINVSRSNYVPLRFGGPIIFHNVLKSKCFMDIPSIYGFLDLSVRAFFLAIRKSCYMEGALQEEWKGKLK
jgi:hypothetical protein